jgi:hypothetical protein
MQSKGIVQFEGLLQARCRSGRRYVRLSGLSRPKKGGQHANRKTIRHKMLFVFCLDTENAHYLRMRRAEDLETAFFMCNGTEALANGQHGQRDTFRVI